MNLVIKTKPRYLISFTLEELTGISNTLNEICNGVDIADAEFQTRLGQSRSQITSILQQIGEVLASADAPSLEVAHAWADNGGGGSVQVRAITVFGDPVDMSTEEALSFAKLITRCAQETT